MTERLSADMPAVMRAETVCQAGQLGPPDHPGRRNGRETRQPAEIAYCQPGDALVDDMRLPAHRTSDALGQRTSLVAIPVDTSSLQAERAED